MDMIEEARRALVTGGTGFIGGHLISALQRDGWRVTAVVRKDTLDRPGMILPAGAAIAVYDGSTSSMVDIVAGARPSTVFHLASLLTGHHDVTQIEPMIKANILLGTQLLEAMQVNGCRHLVNSGTSLQNCQGPVYSPSNLYAATKQAFEAILEYYRGMNSISSVTLQIHNTYGPADNGPRVLSYLMGQLMSSKPLLMSPGEQKLDLVHVDDICSAYLLAAKLLTDEQFRLERSYSVATGRLLSLKQIVSLMEKLAGRSLNVEWGGRAYRPREVMVPWIGSRLPGWCPEVAVEDGIRQLIQSRLVG